MKQIDKRRKIRREIKRIFPEAKNIMFGNNNMTLGYWFDNGENAKFRTFYPIS